jgi:flagellar motor switch protein FliN/FliY
MADTTEAPAAAAAAPAAAEALGISTGENLSLETVYDIPVQITVVLGRTNMQVNQLLKLGRGAVIELDKKVGEPIDIFVNNRLVARGEVVVVEDRIGVTMTEIIKAEKH